MPDGADKHEIADYATVVKARPDVRDLFYLPTLRPLVRSCNVPDMLLRGLLKVRNQLLVAPDDKRGEGTCTAQALANVVDLLRHDNLAATLEAQSKEYERVSPGMLYDHGKIIEIAETGRTEEGLTSLRTAIKGFYHNGVCTDALWQDRDKAKTDEDKLRTLIDGYKDARKTPLGSYYRLHPILNDYHAALNEVGVIYAAAQIHDGWRHESVKEHQGEIKLPGEIKPPHNNQLGLTGGHAFAIVGYTPEGFLILNSWGEEWGNYDPKLDTANPRASGGIIKSRELPGVALWSYQDWAERLIEGWVLRLGVSAPNAFRFSFGRQGIGDYLNGEIKTGSTPRHELIGHYIHVDDGKFVTDGYIPSNTSSIKATRWCLHDRWSEVGAKEKHDKRPEGILLWLAGGSGGMKDVLDHIAKTKDFWKQKKIYPITAVWCSDLMDQAGSFLKQIEEAAFKIVGAPGLDLDRRIEQDVRPIGRAMWRDIGASAAKAASRDTFHDKNQDASAGAILNAYNELTRHKPQESAGAATQFTAKMHLVAEGVGAKLLFELIANVDPIQLRFPTSVTLIMPACTLAEFKDMRNRLSKWGKNIHIIVASEATGRRLRYERYRGSLLQLAQMAFVENPPKRNARSRAPKRDPLDPKMLLRTAQEPRILAADEKSNLVGTHSKRRLMSLLEIPEALVHEINMPDTASSFVSLRELLTSPEVRNEVEKIINFEVERIVKGVDEIRVVDKTNAGAPDRGAKVQSKQGESSSHLGQDETVISLS